jgi:hypothetical protein
MGIKNPQKLSKEEYWTAYADFLYLRKLDKQFWLNIIKQAIAETIGGVTTET